jgi:hypothetical protein
MSFQFDTLHITHQLTTGTGYPFCLGLNEKTIRGSVYLDGPTIIGDENAFKNVEGSLMIGPCNNTDSPVPIVADSISICGALKNPYSLVVRAGSASGAGLFIGDLDVSGVARIKESVISEGDVISQCGVHRLSQKKNFDIPHPSKEGWRLTHSCIEGPEAAVYARGRVTGSTEIELPSYWKDLVDIQSITIQLQPIGSHQDVIIKRWDDKKVYLQSKGGMPIDCFYHIYGERKDTEKLIPEYKGTIEDYPGDNSQRSIAGYHYDVK